ncbi:MAG: SAM-dependent methyltransferase [Gammaproteobacteria bacterium]|nr:SAM-dependent methyltransferase [Gammaproteobacteria bacterium]MDH5801156.1 SAM-dependent methyltransferase [Gammaproteobacteria bacterium]
MELPLPDSVAQAHSEKLIHHICKSIELGGGQLSFADYMGLVLYAPGLGYYSSGAQKFGESGDFVTAPEMSPVFSQCLARQCHAVLPALGDSARILEVGAGSGKMAAELLAELERLDHIPQQYWILELSADLRQRQQQTLKQRLPHLMDRVQWIEQLPAHPFNGIVLANELLDAMPVHRVRANLDADLQEMYVQWNGQRFIEHWGEPGSAALADRLESLSRHFAPGYVSEINLAMESWIHSIGAIMDRGLVLLVDYGFSEQEYYHSQRGDGTLMCHYRHRSHPDPFVYPGLQDITAHVDFTAVAHCGVAAGFNVAGYNSQCYFLMATGLADIMSRHDPDSKEYLRLSQQVKLLTLPSEMGELFKVMALTKAWEEPLLGFSLQDLRANL